MIDFTSLVTPGDMAQLRAWTAGWLADPAALPVSFRCDGRPVRGIAPGWNPVMQRSRVDANIQTVFYGGVDPASGLALKVEVVEYRDYPVIEWTAWLGNLSGKESPLIEGLLGMDAALAGLAEPRLTHCNGDFYSPTGYTPQVSALSEGETLAFAPQGGRPCDQAYPYFRLAGQQAGLALAVGWPGQWSAGFTREGGAVRVQAGQELTHLRLRPGETIRTPRMALLAWAGDDRRAVNLWRRWYLAHVLPRPDGRPMQPLLALAQSDPGEEFTAASEENQLRFQERYRAAGLDFDVWWIDAGWYPCDNGQGECKWWLTGSWRPDPQRFPNGMRSVARSAETGGARLLMWFEPERVTAGSGLDVEHPEWLLHAAGDAQNRLLNLGNPACRAWLTEHTCRLIAENGIAIYRQDFNFEPLRFWREHDAPERQGMTENLHVQGYLQYWDDLLQRNPGLWIDSCASGGRRNDLESMRRAVPLHYTDSSYGVHPVKLAFQHTLYQWIPYFKESTLSWDPAKDGVYTDTLAAGEVDSFSFHCAFAPMLFPIINVRDGDYDHSGEARMAALWRRAAPLLTYGDYYPLTPFSSAGDAWVARQFDHPERGEGFIQAIRLAACPQETLTVRPQGLQPGLRYRLENPERGETLEIDGASLMNEGFTVSLPPRSGAVWFYRAL